MKPMLASDWDASKLKKFPYIMQPKVDGVRGLNLGLGFTGRSLKRHKNIHVTNYFSQAAFRYLDGEVAAEHECNPALCRLTTSALNTIEGQPFVLWHLFDYVAPDTIHRPYAERFGALKRRYWQIYQEQPEFAAHLRIIPFQYVNDLAEMERVHAAFIAQGYEGSIIRDPEGMYKNGRSTPTEGGLLRIKDFVEEEAIVIRLEEGQQNTNEAVINELGQTERSTHMANMVPNGMVGALHCMDMKTKKPIKVAAGSMPHSDRELYFSQPSLLLGKVIKYKTFLHGVKDKPRFPTFQCIRAESDI